jgi:hypothetical protein
MALKRPNTAHNARVFEPPAPHLATDSAAFFASSILAFA